MKLPVAVKTLILKLINNILKRGNIIMSLVTEIEEYILNEDGCCVDMVAEGRRLAVFADEELKTIPIEESKAVEKYNKWIGTHPACFRK